MKRTTLEIEGMSCGHCITAVQKALSQLPNVEIENVSIGSATVQHDPNRTGIDALVDAVADAGYTAEEKV